MMTIKQSADNKSNRFDSDGRAFLPAALELTETPPHPLGRILALLIALLFALAIVWAALSEVDIVAVAEGRVVPTGQIKVVQPFQSGVVSEINVAEGRHVNAGDIVFRLDDTEATANRAKAQLALSHAELARATAEALLSNDPIANYAPAADVDANLIELGRRVVEQKYSNHRDRMAEAKAELTRLQIEEEALRQRQLSQQASVAELTALHERVKKLAALDLATQSELSDIAIQLVPARAQLDQIAFALRQNEVERERSQHGLGVLEAEFFGTLNEQLAAAKQDMMVAEQEIQQMEQRARLHILRAPVSGTVNELLVHTVGAVVSPSQKLMTIVPDDAELVVEAALENRDVGFVKAGQNAEVKLEAFPFTRFGVLDAKVSAVSADAIVDPDRGPLFKVLVRPARFETSAESPVRLSPGMRASVEITTGKRTVLEFFFAPLLRYKDEAIRVR